MMGEIGAATYVKIATNLIMGAQIEILAEALELLKLGKVPLSLLGAALQHSAANSGVIAMKLPLMLQGNFEPHFSIKNMLKDLQFGLDIAASHQINLPTTAATATAFVKAIEHGLGDADTAALAAHYGYSGTEANFFSLMPPASSASTVNGSKKLSPYKKSFFSFFKK